ncbi:flagellar export protein FliJ [Solemya pervernicosa gill symbiont]|uniref:Flagellar FliJ protein n=1 Tax=Solemya pervernicosa gill symbiont TaxID=642797 RepID=A0A1T2LAJ0_9GAMM|nr:flagellar export protein FliJ [Solemya pervernicosa gill symbiont]OOZ42128.1 flagellar export protein FliJ [Solemya pervernicosa gill symbiont]
MVRSKRMRPVADIAENREREAAKRFGQSQNAVNEQKQRLEELLQYRLDYQQQFDQRAGSGMSVAMMQDFRRFINQLNDAIKHQQRQIEQYQRNCDLSRSEWLSKRTHSQAIDKVVGRYRKHEQRRESQREQHESDEFVTQSFSRPKGKG